MTEDHERGSFLDLIQRLSFEGAILGDECPECVPQAANGFRAAKLARAELEQRSNTELGSTQRRRRPSGSAAFEHASWSGPPGALIG